MNKFENIAGRTASHYTGLRNDGNPVAGHHPLMWFMALLLSTLMVGCGGGGGGGGSTTAASASTALPGAAGTAGANATNPTVISSNPANLATNVPTSTNSWDAIGAINVVTGTQVIATFNEAMNLATITAAGTFTLKETISGANVPGAVAMDAAHKIATFTPTAAALTANTSYTATVTTAATRASDSTAMPNAVVWSFTTNAALLTGQAPVNLLSAGDFAILTNTAAFTYNGIASAAAVTGDVGMATLTSASFAGFHNYAVDASIDFATADEVVAPGKIYAPDYTGVGGLGLTPAKMVLAGTDMTKAYNDGAGRTAGVGTFLEVGTPVGTLDNLILPPGTYTWAGNVISSGASTVTLSGGPNDVWIFQIGGFFRPGNGSSVLLSSPTGGALPQAKNIFWVVAGADATLGTTAHVEGVILTGVGFITLNGLATVNGRLLAHTAATLGGTVTPPAP